jgi:hypothetical protein
MQWSDKTGDRASDVSDGLPRGISALFSYCYGQVVCGTA